MKTLVTLFMICTAVTVQAQFDLEINFANMTPHVGQMGYVRVIDNGTNQEVVRIQHEIPSPDFSVHMLCLRSGHSYTVDFYADMNMNGMYDAPPMDHAWRRSVPDVGDNVVLSFIHNTQFTDIEFPQRPVATTNIVRSLWAGRWTNETFNTNGPGNADLTLNGLTNTISGSITMEGAFGSPTPVTIQGAGNWDQAADSALMVIDPPLGGTISFVRGKVNGTLTYDAFGMQMIIAGNYGRDQIMFTYDLSGQVTAHGWMYLDRGETTDIEDDVANATSVYPNPATDKATLKWNTTWDTSWDTSWHQAHGTAKQVIGYSLIGDRYELPIISTVAGVATIDVSSLTSGVYSVHVTTEGGVVSAVLIK